MASPCRDSRENTEDWRSQSVAGSSYLKSLCVYHLMLHAGRRQDEMSCLLSLFLEEMFAASHRAALYQLFISRLGEEFISINLHVGPNIRFTRFYRLRPNWNCRCGDPAFISDASDQRGVGWNTRCLLKSSHAFFFFLFFHFNISSVFGLLPGLEATLASVTPDPNGFWPWNGGLVTEVHCSALVH